MADLGKGNGEGQGSGNGEKVSQILVTFMGVGMADIKEAKWQGVSPLQMLALAKWLEFKGMNLLAQREMVEAQKKAEERAAVGQVQAMLGKKDLVA